jgi:RNA polymerase sigma-70 factor, ECF subfamily
MKNVASKTPQAASFPTSEDPESQFDTLFRNTHQALLKKTNRYVRNLDAAKDIVQEIFISIWNNRMNALQNAAAKAYLEKACINRALNYLRDKKRFSQLPDGASPELFAHHDSPCTRLMFSQLYDGIMGVINSLPDKVREPFLLSRFEQLTYEQIAQSMGISVVAVEKNIRKALKELRVYIGSAGLKILLFVALAGEASPKAANVHGKAASWVTTSGKRPDVKWL